MKTAAALLAIACCSQPLVAAVAASSHPTNQMYLDVQQVNTSMHLESIRKLPLSTYRLSYERSIDTKQPHRKRVGVVGSELASIIPDAVDIVPQRTLPPRTKGEKPIVLHNFPSINEQTLFMYSVGGVQELAKMMTELESRANNQKS